MEVILKLLKENKFLKINYQTNRGKKVIYRESKAHLLVFKKNQRNKSYL